MLTIADEVGGWVHEPLILADVICEQPLISVYNLHLPKIGQNLISAGHWDQYITLHLKLLQWHWGDGTKCKTCFGGPRMILHAH